MRYPNAVGEIDCRKCGRALAESPDGHILRVGAVALFNRVVMQCARCGQITVWEERPVDEYDRTDLPPDKLAVSDEVRRRLGKD